MASARFMKDKNTDKDRIWSVTDAKARLSELMQLAEKRTAVQWQAKFGCSDSSQTLDNPCWTSQVIGRVVAPKFRVESNFKLLTEMNRIVKYRFKKRMKSGSTVQ